MIELFLGLMVLSFMFWLSWKFTAVMLKIAFWLFIKLPCAIILLMFGVAFCITIIGIPIGRAFCRWGADIMT